jgi:hypothetical protein
MKWIYKIFLLAVMLPVMAWAQWGGLSAEQERSLYAAKFNLPPIVGTYYYVDPRFGNESNSGLKPEVALCSLKSAVNKCKNGYGDGVCLMPRDTGSADTLFNFVLSKTCTINVAGVTICGISAGHSRYAKITGVIKKARTLSLPSLLYVNAPNVRLYNLYVSNSDSLGYRAIRVSKNANDFYCENVYAEGGVNATLAACSTYTCALQIDSASNCEVKNSIFGNLTTILGPASSQGQIYLNGPQIGNRFYNCITQSRSDSVNMVAAIRVGGANSIYGWSIFKDCIFTAMAIDSTIGAMTSIVRGTAQNKAGLLVVDCAYVGYTAYDGIDAALTYVNRNATTTAASDSLNRGYAR